MAATQSTMLPLGSLAPNFSLPDTMSDRVLSLEELRGSQATVVMFICNHCPYVVHVKPQLIAMAAEYRSQGVAFVAISANDIVSYPQDAPDHMKRLMQDWGQPFDAYLYDESQSVARAYQAACTPDFYLFNQGLELVYRGRMDGSTPKNAIKLDAADLRAALDAVLKCQPVSSEQFPSIGCNIKWKTDESLASL